LTIQNVRCDDTRMQLRTLGPSDLLKAPPRQSAAPLTEPPGHAVREAQQLVAAANRVLEAAVIADRAAGTSWEEIGDALGGVTRSTAHGRFATVVEEFNNTAVDSASAAEPQSRADRAAENLEAAWSQVLGMVDRRVVRGGLQEAAENLVAPPPEQHGTRSPAPDGKEETEPERVTDPARTQRTDHQSRSALEHIALRNWIAHQPADSSNAAALWLLWAALRSPQQKTNRYADALYGDHVLQTNWHPHSHEPNFEALARLLLTCDREDVSSGAAPTSNRVRSGKKSTSPAEDRAGESAIEALERRVAQIEATLSRAEAGGS
jgi:hypothetical protein